MFPHYFVLFNSAIKLVTITDCKRTHLSPPPPFLPPSLSLPPPSLSLSLSLPLSLTLSFSLSLSLFLSLSLSFALFLSLSLSISLSLSPSLSCSHFSRSHISLSQETHACWRKLEENPTMSLQIACPNFELHLSNCRWGGGYEMRRRLKMPGLERARWQSTCSMSMSTSLHSNTNTCLCCCCEMSCPHCCTRGRERERERERLLFIGTLLGTMAHD